MNCMFFFPGGEVEEWYGFWMNEKKNFDCWLFGPHLWEEGFGPFIYMMD